MDFSPLQRSKKRDKRTVGSVYIVIADCNICRADGTLLKIGMLYNGLKSVVTKWFEPAALQSKNQKVMISDKICQPFFTTKPTGQGTGLGLSLSYDIVKAHGGELKVDTEEGEYAEFIVILQTSY
jgi:hypothetical protein